MIEEIKDIYECYALLGKVSREQDKLYYWEQQKIFFKIFEPYLREWGDKKININQCFEILLKVSKGGIPHVTNKNAATGGYRNWNLENVHDITTRHLTNNEHLIHSFDNYGKGYLDFYPKDKKSGLIKVINAWVEASLKKNKNTPHDLYMKFGDWNRLN